MATEYDQHGLDNCLKATALARALNLDSNNKCLFLGTDPKPGCARSSFVKEHESKKRSRALAVVSLTGHVETMAIPRNL